MYSGVNIDGRWHRWDATHIEAIANEVQALLEKKPAGQKIAFEVRRSRKDGTYFINKKGDPEYRVLKAFDTKEAAVACRSSNREDLIQACADVIDRDNLRPRPPTPRSSA